MTHSELSEQLWIFDVRVAACAKALRPARSGRGTPPRLTSSRLTFARAWDKSASAESLFEYVQMLTAASKNLRAACDGLRAIAQAVSKRPSGDTAQVLEEGKALCRVVGNFVRQTQAGNRPLPLASTNRQMQLSERLWILEARVLKTADTLPDSPLARHIAEQLRDSGSSFAPSFDERGAATSGVQAAQVLTITLKELRETRGWLRFIARAALLPGETVSELIEEATALCRTLGQSVRRARASLASRLGRFEVSETHPLSSASSRSSLEQSAGLVATTELWRAGGFGFDLSTTAHGRPVKTRFA